MNEQDRKLENLYKDIIEHLAESTQRGKVRWIERGSTRSRSTFYILFDRSSIELSQAPGGPGDRLPSYRIGLINESGQTADFKIIEPDDSHYDKISDLYTSARRIARGFDEVLDDVMMGLRSGGHIGNIPPEQSGGSNR